MPTVQYAKDPFYNDPNNETILLTVKFIEFNEEIPFTATPYDNMDYGRQLYEQAKNGDFGPVKSWNENPSYVPPTLESEKQLIATKGVYFETKVIGNIGKAPYVITLISEPPDGFQFDGDKLFGTPLLEGNFEFVFNVKDALNNQGETIKKLMVFQQ